RFVDPAFLIAKLYSRIRVLSQTLTESGQVDEVKTGTVPRCKIARQIGVVDLGMMECHIDQSTHRTFHAIVSLHRDVRYNDVVGALALFRAVCTVGKRFALVRISGADR